MTAPKLIDAEAAAKMVGVHKESLLRNIRSGRWPITVHKRKTAHAAVKYYFDPTDVRRQTLGSQNRRYQAAK